MTSYRQVVIACGPDRPAQTARDAYGVQVHPERTRRGGWWLTIAAVVIAVMCACVGVAALSVLSSWAGPRDGDDLARDMIRSAAAQLEVDLGHLNRPRDVETVAAGIKAGEFGAKWVSGSYGMLVEPVAWSGRVTGSEQASIDVRFTASVPASNGESFGDSGNTAGTATMCYRYLLQLYRYTEREEIDCPDIDDPPTPVPEVIPSLPDDASERLATVLLAATPDSLQTDVRAAFPDDSITVDTATHGDELVAAVGVPAERDCLVAVRRVDGTVDYPGYDRIWLEPGEVGCRVTLYTAPPR
jgi:hypothetical protein